MAEAVTGRKGGDDWTDQDVARLRELAKGNTPTGVMSVKPGRSEDAIHANAKSEGIPPAPVNRPPYGDVSG